MDGGGTSQECHIASYHRQNYDRFFVTHGLPEMLVSDNGTAFASAEFREFTSRNAIRHIFVSPYHPSSNGLAERAVQSFKSAWKKSPEGSTETRIAKFSVPPETYTSHVNW